MKTFSFAVSGDSRNCGDVVVPAIAAAVNGSSFYWHLGDFRAMFMIDEDIADTHRDPKPTLAEYYNSIAWPDFIENQVKKFSIPVYLLPGNHETSYPTVKYPTDLNPQPGVTVKKMDDYMTAFGEYRAKNSDNHEHPYYRWTIGNVDFISMDNSSDDQFDDQQTTWFNKILDTDEKNAGVTTIVVGMHEALPDSIASDHSMDQAKGPGKTNGKTVYRRLLEAQKAGKFVYVLASHSHYYMEGTFKNHAPEDRIPGWIVGTAGAIRYKLPAKADLTVAPKTHVYGYVIGTVQPKGDIKFQFSELSEDDLSRAASSRYSSDLVHKCFTENAQK